MEKSIFLETANNLYEEAVSATSYWLVIQQFRKNTDEYYDDVPLHFITSSIKRSWMGSLCAYPSFMIGILDP